MESRHSRQVISGVRHGGLISSIAIAAASAALPGGCQQDTADPVAESVAAAVVDPVAQTIATLDDATGRIAETPGSWQKVLQDALNQLADSTPAAARLELQALLDNSTAVVKVSEICTNEVVAVRASLGLEAIKARLLGRHPAPPSPLVCAASPPVVELAAWQQDRVPAVHLIGFDLDVPLQIQLVQTTETTRVSDAMVRVDPYQVTIDLGAAGLRLTPRSQRVVVSTSATPAVELSEISVIPVQAALCETRDVTESISPISFLPLLLTRGDDEFFGNGPRIQGFVALTPLNAGLGFNLGISATETRSDFTTIVGSGFGNLSVDPPLPSGFRVDRVNGPTESRADYTDTNSTDDSTLPTNGGPVHDFVFTGDTIGPDLGRTRLVAANFNVVGLHLVATGNCVPPSLVPTLLKREDVTPEFKHWLQGAVKQ